MTGNIGSGKSTVAEIFKAIGVPVFHADNEAKKLLELNKIVVDVKRHFGEDVLDQGSVDKKKLAGIVFNDSQALSTLNSIIHPRVRENFLKWIKIHKNQPYIIQEAAILFESGFYSFFDKTILISCPETLAIQRTMKRDGVSEEEVRARLRNQWPEGKKRGMADFNINNDGTSLLIPQVLAIHNTLCKK